MFLRNLLLNENNKLQNRELHVKSELLVTKSREDKILELIKETPKITINELAVILGLSVRTIKSIIKTLVDNNIIKRTNGKKYGHWEIINY